MANKSKKICVAKETLPEVNTPLASKPQKERLRQLLADMGVTMPEDFYRTITFFQAVVLIGEASRYMQKEVDELVSQYAKYWQQVGCPEDLPSKPDICFDGKSQRAS